MENNQNLYNLLPLEPLTPEEIGRNPKEMPQVPDDILQLQTDTINVLEGRVELSFFDKEYQKKIKYLWQFAGIRYTTKETIIAKRNMQTFELV